MIEIGGVALALALAGSWAIYRRKKRFVALPSVLDDTRARVKELRGYTSKILNARMNAKMRAITDRAERIIKLMEKEPARYSGNKALVGFVIETACRVAKAYADLSHEAGSHSEGKATLQRLESSVPQLEEAFDKQLQKLVEKDIINIDVELEMLKKTLKMEGL